MPPPRKRRRAFISPPSPDQTPTTPQRPPEPEDVEPPAPTHPYDLLPEIAARSDFTTLARCAACCKALRREILRQAFIRRVVCRSEPGTGSTVVVPPCAIGFLHAYDKARMEADQPPPAPCFSVAHPAMPGVASFFEKHLAPFAARTAGKSLLGDYEPLTSRHGLVVLRRRYFGGGRCSDICVYDPMSGGRTFLPSPPDIRVRERKASDYGVSYTYVLLTAADGIGIGGGSFHVLAVDFTGLRLHSAKIMVQMVSSDNAGGGACAWGPVTVATHPRSRWFRLQPHCSAVVLCGLIHWLMYVEDFWEEEHFHILTYEVRTATAGSIELPKGKGDLPKDCRASNLHLASSPDGRLSLHVSDKRKISVWLLRPAAGAGGDGWSRHAVIDIEMTAGSLTPQDTPYFWWLKEVAEFESSGARSGAILLRPFTGIWPTDNKEEEEQGEKGLAVLDLETEELRRVIKKKNITVFLYEIDLEARLLAMKPF